MNNDTQQPEQAKPMAEKPILQQLDEARQRLARAEAEMKIEKEVVRLLDDRAVDWTEMETCP